MEGMPSVARSSSCAFRFGAMRLLVLDTLKHNCAAGNREQVPEYSQIIQQLCGLRQRHPGDKKTCRLGHVFTGFLTKFRADIGPILARVKKRWCL